MGSTSDVSKFIYDLSSHALEDGRLYKDCVEALDKGTACEFRFRIDQELIDSGYFPFVFGLIASLFKSFRRPFFLDVKDSTTCLEVSEIESCVYDLILEASQSEKTNPMMRENLKIFYEKLHFKVK